MRVRTISEVTTTTATQDGEEECWEEDDTLRPATGMPIWLEWGGARRRTSGAARPPEGCVSFRCRPRGQEAGSTARTTSSKGRPATQCWWRLVWCHERCLKSECDVRRQAVSMAAREAGALLICMKKASKFAAWLGQKQRPPLVLLTDWREVKPCLQAASEQPPRNRPALVLVLCDVPAQYERAKAWARTCPPGTEKVRVIKDIGLPRDLLAGLLSELLESELLQEQLEACEEDPPCLTGLEEALAKASTSPTVTNSPPKLSKEVVQLLGKKDTSAFSRSTSGGGSTSEAMMVLPPPGLANPA